MPTIYEQGDVSRTAQADATTLARDLANFKIQNQGRDPFFVFNPHPEKWRLVFKTPQKLRNFLKMYAGEVITGEQAIKIYRVDPEDIDKTNNNVVRFGQILCRIPVEAYLAKIAKAKLTALDMIDHEVQAFNEASGAKDILARVNKNNEYDYSNAQNVPKAAVQFSPAEIAAVMRMRQQAAIVQSRNPTVIAPHRIEGDDIIIGNGPGSDQVDMSVFEEKDVETKYSFAGEAVK